jgi:hypothetical protein
MTIVHNSKVIAGLFILPTRPQACEPDRPTITPREIVQPLAVWRVVPIVIAARGDLTLERVAEHRFGRDSFGPRIEGGDPHFLERLVPQIGIRPQPIGTSSRAPSEEIKVSIVVVAQML